MDPTLVVHHRLIAFSVAQVNMQGKVLPAVLTVLPVSIVLQAPKFVQLVLLDIILIHNLAAVPYAKLVPLTN